MDEDATPRPQGRRNGKSAEAFRTISEVASDLDLPQHVLRFWESKFPQVKPLKRGGGRRYYRPEDMVLLRRIRDLLYTEGYTIRGVQKLLRENGVKAVANGEAAAAGNGTGEAAADMVAGDGDLDARQRKALVALLADLEAIRDQLRDK